MPAGGLFRAKNWLLSPEPLQLEKPIVAEIEELAGLLASFLAHANDLYHDSHSGVAEAWISELLDAGKPGSIVELGLSSTFRDQIPRVIRPDLLLTGDGLKLTEIDSLPGGIGLSAWLNQLYATGGWPVIGGPRGMIDGFQQLLDGGKVYISREALDYRPEMAWILDQMAENGDAPVEDRLIDTRDFDPAGAPPEIAYRYFELWDLANVEHAEAFQRLASSGDTRFTPPMKAYLEEKLWLSLLWSPGLTKEWRSRLGAAGAERLKHFVPESWILDPSPIPHFAEYPGLGIQSWEELKAFSQRERQLVVKISGFSETAWGSRGVHIGHDLPSSEWSSVIDAALEGFSIAPHVMQRFHQAKTIQHPYYEPATGEVRVMDGRVRLCPYYFVRDAAVELGGILATICPQDKKIIHGMTDAILVPCISA